MKIELVKHEKGSDVGYWVMVNESYMGKSKFFTNEGEAIIYFNECMNPENHQEIKTVLKTFEL